MHNLYELATLSEDFIKRTGNEIEAKGVDLTDVTPIDYPEKIREIGGKGELPYKTITGKAMANLIANQLVIAMFNNILPFSQLSNTDFLFDGPTMSLFYLFSGSVVAPNGKVILVPDESPVIGIYDPVTNTYEDGPEHGQKLIDDYYEPFCAGVLAPNGKVILIPAYGPVIGIYDPVTNTYEDGPEHGIEVSEVYGDYIDYYQIFRSGVVTPNGKIVLIPACSPVIGIYDPVTNTYEDGPEYGQVEIWDEFFSAGVVAPNNGLVILAPYEHTHIGIFNPITKVYTDGIPHEKDQASFNDAVLTPIGEIIFIPGYVDGYVMGIYDPINNTYKDGAFYYTGDNNSGFSDGVLTSTGKIIMNPRSNYGAIGIYDYINDIYTDGPTLQNRNVFENGVLTGRGDIVFTPRNLFGIYNTTRNIINRLEVGLPKNDASTNDILNVNVLDPSPVTTPYTYTEGYSHGRGLNAFSGAVLAPNGNIIYVPRNSTVIGIYDFRGGKRGYKNGPTHGRGTNAFRKSTLAPNGKVILTPHNSTNIGIYDPIANTYTNGPTHGAGSLAFSDGVLAPNGKIILAPNYALSIGIYDPITNTYTKGPSRGSSYRFSGAVLAPNGKIIFIPRVLDDSRSIGIYDPIANTYEDGPTIERTDTFANDFFSCGILASNGKVILVPEYADYIGIYDPVENTFVWGPDPFTIGKLTRYIISAFLGAVTSPNGEIIFVPCNWDRVGIYDPIKNTFFQGPLHGQGLNKMVFWGGVVAPNGTIVFAPHYYNEGFLDLP